MAYLVNITARAERDFTGIYVAIDAEESETARKWFRGMMRAILSLEELPARCPATKENPSLRHLLYGRQPHVYRIIFRIIEDRQQVEVLHIRHGARRELKPAGVKKARPGKSRRS